MEHFEKAIEYVRENKTWDEAEEIVALKWMDEWRCPLSMVACGDIIANGIHDLMEEYGMNNDLPEGWWREYVDDEEEIFWKL